MKDIKTKEVTTKPKTKNPASRIPKELMRTAILESKEKSQTICCLYVFSGASVYLMLWSDMETVSIPLKFFVYGNPMYYWMNFSSCRTMGIIEHLPFYFIGCISLLIVGGLIMIRKEIK